MVVLKEQLTDAMIDAGAEMTRKLDEIGLPLTAALWTFDPEKNDWRLLFASPEVTTQGPIAVYTKIQQALADLKDRAATGIFSVIRLKDGEDELVKLLRCGVRTGPGLRRMRFSKSAINGHYIEDALIYRVV